nr:hypothetical protein [Candidatus Sigynarchaeota archaeon]
MDIRGEKYPVPCSLVEESAVRVVIEFRAKFTNQQQAPAPLAARSCSSSKKHPTRDMGSACKMLMDAIKAATKPSPADAERPYHPA